MANILHSSKRFGFAAKIRKKNDTGKKKCPYGVEKKYFAISVFIYIFVF